MIVTVRIGAVALAALGTNTGDVPMHAIVAQRSESGSFGCGQHGCDADATGVHVIAVHAMEADTSVNNSMRAENLLIPSPILCAPPDIAFDTARWWPQLGV